MRRSNDPGSSEDSREERVRERGRRWGRSFGREETPESASLREARAHARRKIGFLFHVVPYAFVCSSLLLTAGFRTAAVVGFFWGIGIASHALAVIAPRLRRRFVDQEVSRHLQHRVRSERRALEGAHARSLEELSASIAHEIRNPVTAAKSLVQQMGEDPRARENVEYARVALEELDRVERSIAHLLRFAREEPLRLEPVRLSEAFTGALEVLADRVQRSGVEIVRDFDASDTIDGDPEKLRRVAINLVANALDAIASFGVPRPRIELSTGRGLGGREVFATVRDNGIGIDDRARDRIFQPFYTDKEHGTGLGLPLVKKWVEAHGGSIDVRSARGMGSEFVLTFPAPRGERDAT